MGTGNTVLRFSRYHCLDRDHCSVQYKQQTDDTVRRFEESYPGIAVESRILRNWYQFVSELRRDLAAGAGPDILHFSGGAILNEFVESGWLLDLTEDLAQEGWGDTFHPASLTTLAVDGRVYGVPLEQGFIFFWYNKHIFDRLGLAVPETFEGLVETCREAKRAGLIPISFGMKERWPGDFFYSYLLQRTAGDGILVDDVTRLPDLAAARDHFATAGDRIRTLIALGAFPGDFMYMDYPQMRALYAQGGAAMMLMGNRMVDYLKTEGPASLESSGVFAFPVVGNGSGGTDTLFGGSLATFAISANTGNRDAAVRFVKTATDETARRDITRKLGDIPALRRVPRGDFSVPVQSDMADLLSAAKRVYVHYFKCLLPPVAGRYLNALHQLYAGEISSEEVFSQVEQATREMRYGTTNATGGDSNNLGKAG